MLREGRIRVKGNTEGIPQTSLGEKINAILPEPGEAGRFPSQPPMLGRGGLHPIERLSFWLDSSGGAEGLFEQAFLLRSNFRGIGGNKERGAAPGNQFQPLTRHGQRDGF